MDLYQFYSYDTPGVKTGPNPGVISWNNSNREGRIHFVGKLTQVSNSGPSWPSCLIPSLKPNFFLAHLSVNSYINIFSSETCQQILIKLHKNDSQVMPFQNTLNSMKNYGCHGNQKKKALTIFLFQTVVARAFIFGMLHHLVALYQNISNYGHSIKISPM